ncbi:MAG: DUF1311 domain-containing protein [Nitrospinae bacterium]|nr:DUF1311 domain-containing protein [Nitrospinota bacterium]
MNKTTLVLCAMVIIMACPVAWKKAWAEDCLDALAQTDMNLCASNDARKTERELEAVYKKLMKKIRPKGQAKLRAVQNAWIKYRKEQCEFNTMGSISGSIHPTVLSYCYAHLADQQKKILQEQLDCEEGDLSCGHQ